MTEKVLRQTVHRDDLVVRCPHCLNRFAQPLEIIDQEIDVPKNVSHVPFQQLTDQERDELRKDWEL